MILEASLFLYRVTSDGVAEYFFDLVYAVTFFLAVTFESQLSREFRKLDNLQILVIFVCAVSTLGSTLLWKKKDVNAEKICEYHTLKT